MNYFTKQKTVNIDTPIYTKPIQMVFNLYIITSIQVFTTSVPQSDDKIPKKKLKHCTFKIFYEWNKIFGKGWYPVFSIILIK